MHWPITVASFRTWRGSQDYIARDPAPDIWILTSESVPNLLVTVFDSAWKTPMWNAKSVSAKIDSPRK